MRFFFFFLVLLLCGSYAHAEEATYPRLFFRYSFLYDRVCAREQPVEDAWADEADEKTDEFSRLWEKEAPVLFGRLFADFSNGFSRKEMTATLSVCPQGVSFSDPLVLKVVRFLKSYMQEKPVWPDYAFVDLVFHELLHTWLAENLNRSTPLLEKYKSENPSVRAHLHLMALQIHVYEGLGRKDLLDWINDLYPKMKDVYPRAWSIVKAEGHEAFISELRK